MANANVIICGAGVIGAAVAYFLSLRDVNVTVVERSASGLALAELIVDGINRY